MKNVNPMDRTPDNYESVANARHCSCICNTQMNNKSDAYDFAWLPLVDDCQSTCAPGNNDNKEYNQSDADAGSYQ